MPDDFDWKQLKSEHGGWKYLNELRSLSRNQRKEMTEAERIIWDKVLKQRQTGYKFLRQKPIGKFMVDFYCAKLLIVVEIDGEVHENRKNYDQGRDTLLGAWQIETIRYKNAEVLENIDLIKTDLNQKIHTRVIYIKSNPALFKGGERGGCR